MLRKLKITAIIAAPAFAAIVSTAIASPYDVEVKPELFPDKKIYSPFVDRSYPDQVLFGDSHFHTNLSFDAGLIGTRLTAHEGFRFARGEKVISNTGQPVQLIRPLDFLVITDHAEFIGLAPMIQESDPNLLADPWGKSIYDLFNSGQEGRMQAFGEIIEIGTVTMVNPFSSDKAAINIWQNFVEIADTYNEPGRFTALTGYEWTSTPKGNNLHRCVILADGADITSQTHPFSTFDSQDPEDLWKYLALYEEKTGGRAMAIPHNGNLSNGLMFNGKTFKGEDITREYAERRMRWEPLYEMTQIKGDEEAHPFLSPDDEFADFENWDVSNLSGTAAKEDWMLQYEYARPVLKLGLKLGQELGVNPFKFGLMGTTDTHTALATTREENYFGKYQHTEPSADRHNSEVIPAEDPALRIMTSQEQAGSLMGVWARENTRRDIFNAMQRKEVYATTGTRIRVRVFGGWDFTDDEVSRPDFVDQGYKRGVPMGGDLRNAPDGKPPSFMIRALRDPDGANLDRIQIIKGWLDAQGETHERIYDVAVSGDRKIDDDGRSREPIGTTVDIENATYTNTIGEALLAAYWQDPEFDPAQSAFYYIRVLEIPTPRWTTYDAAFFNIERPDNVPATVQDRAYTSPIWYTP
ncbi:MAG: DUF3604 domain-containing protein [Desulfobacterales bacterium]|nr:DUF3604 domain-containing protein [Desulfofustis sp.]NNK93673.1 DUF3604 domain-containing protein [Desulfobacterales bacterium]